jgi:hypothetical protein
VERLRSAYDFDSTEGKHAEDRNRLADLSITHKSSADYDAQFDVGETSYTAPHNGVAGWWVLRAGQIAS